MALLLLHDVARVVRLRGFRAPPPQPHRLIYYELQGLAAIHANLDSRPLNSSYRIELEMLRKRRGFGAPPPQPHHLICYELQGLVAIYSYKERP